MIRPAWTAKLAMAVAALGLLLACPAREAPGPAPARQTRDASASGQARALALPDAGTDVLLAGGPVRPEPPERDPDAPRVRLRLTVVPVGAEVHWGRKKLGIAGRTPLEIDRLRNSGPLDLVIKAEGFLPFHTRMHTDRDESLVVRLVRPADARSLLGWRPPGNPGSATPR